MTTPHVICDLLLEDTPRNVALVNVLIYDVAAILGSFFLRMFNCALVWIKAIEVDKLLLNQITLALVGAVASTRDNWKTLLLEIGDHFLVVSKHLNCVW